MFNDNICVNIKEDEVTDVKLAVTTRPIVFTTNYSDHGDTPVTWTDSKVGMILVLCLTGVIAFILMIMLLFVIVRCRGRDKTKSGCSHNECVAHLKVSDKIEQCEYFV